MLCGLYFYLTDKNRQRKRTQSVPSERKSATTFVAAHDLIDHRTAVVRHHAYNRFAFHSPIVVRHHVVSTAAYPDLQNAGRVIAAVDTRAKDPNAVARTVVFVDISLAQYAKHSGGASCLDFLFIELTVVQHNLRRTASSAAVEADFFTTLGARSVDTGTTSIPFAPLPDNMNQPANKKPPLQRRDRKLKNRGCFIGLFYCYVTARIYTQIISRQHFSSSNTTLAQQYHGSSPPIQASVLHSMQAKGSNSRSLFARDACCCQSVDIPCADRRRTTKRRTKITFVFPYARLPLNT